MSDSTGRSLIARSLWIVWADFRDVEDNPWTYTHVDERGHAEERFVYGLAPEVDLRG